MVKACGAEKRGVQKRLEEELERLQQAIGMGHSLRVVWMPSVDKPLSGEVKGDVIIIYESDESEALQVLKHEVIDFLVSQAIEPYRNVTNALIKVVIESAYQRKEKVVEAINRLVAETSA